MKTNQKSKIKNQKDIAIELINISKRYTIHHEKPTLVEHLINGKNETFWALKNINLEIRKGEKVGIIGPNGSGKTTLLKIIAGITSPTSGQVKTYGKIVSLIDLEAGFHPDLTGYQNIFLNGMLLGMSKREINSKLSEIIDFADIGQFIDVPMYTYSAGMKLRLGFAVAVHAEPEILILDENLSAGDENFRKKSVNKMNEFYNAKKTIILVTHELDIVKKYTSRLLVLHEGQFPMIIKQKK